MNTTPHRLAMLLRSRPLNLALGMLLAWAWGLFCYAHLQAFLRSGDWSYLLFCASESLVAVLFLIRSEPARVSASPLDWGLAIAATFVPFLFSPTGETVVPAARLMIVAGVLIQIAGLLSLNRSFGLVAAHRTLKTGGLYSVVRHPLYASYLLSYAGYIVNNTSALNVAVSVLSGALMVARLLREERFLARDPRYLAYMAQVKYRVIPRLF
ncbi:isoprenylcysteine carboxylmethyltransferase family protein [Duganella sp. FT3S]|uniref:Isoprenylcysteine carboxylmethyltransferase family protein n=1 Tax=Rugamonas fusca TaxID=2758568 RepID=A0A7W2I7Y4_9BURK|nr:isoprenylcysteine carboxylmethyltransferase family protein [Rugamonas fusca]MBA5606949.1 isoprenylcysteine carboxylmethyltransferase family protein [Rugamonas fusca]